MRDRDETHRMGAARLIEAFLADERGATALEYSLMVSLIFMVILAAVGSTGSDLGGRWAAMAGVIVENLLGAR